MKLLALSRRPDAPFLMPPGLWLAPDSAIVGPGRPLFLPDFTEEWSVVAMPAIRISRLGKNIAPKFASRYYDALTLCARLIPVDVVSTLQLRGEPTALASAFDNCVQLGSWQLIDDTHPLPDRLDIRYGELSVAVDSFISQAASAIANISRYVTLRTGDIVCPCSLPLSIPVAPDTDLRASVNGTELLSARIK